MPGFIYSNRDSKDRWFVLVPEDDMKNSMELRSYIWNYRGQFWNASSATLWEATSLSFSLAV